MIKSENARLNGWIFVDIEGVDLGFDASLDMSRSSIEGLSGTAMRLAGDAVLVNILVVAFFKVVVF